MSDTLDALRSSLRWQDTPAVYGPHTTLDNRLAHRSRLGIFDRIFRALARPVAD